MEIYAGDRRSASVSAESCIRDHLRLDKEDAVDEDILILRVLP